LARWTPPGGCSKKATWVHLGPPGRERATDIDIHLVDAVRSTPQVDFGQIGRLGSKKEVLPGQVEAFAPTAIALPNLV
jgi:hypothetical protein